MKKPIVFSLILVLVLVALLACEPGDSSTKLDLDGKIKEVNIFVANEFDKEDSDLFVV